MAEDIIRGYKLDSLNKLLTIDTLLMFKLIVKQGAIIKSHERSEVIMLEQVVLTNTIIETKDLQIEDRDKEIKRQKKHKWGAILGAAVIVLISLFVGG